MKLKIINAILILLIISVLEMVVLIIATILQTLSELKLNFTSDALYKAIINVLTSPIGTAQHFIHDKNPIVIILGIAVPIYVIYSFFKSTKKNNEPWEVDEKHGYHGTARFAKHNEIAKDSNFKLQTPKDVLSEFEESLKKGDKL